MGTKSRQLLIIGSVVGPGTYPGMVRDFQSVDWGKPGQMHRLAVRQHQALFAVLGWINAIGISSRYPLVPDLPWSFIGVEGGQGTDTGEHSASLQGGPEPPRLLVTYCRMRTAQVTAGIDSAGSTIRCRA